MIKLPSAITIIFIDIMWRRYHNLVDYCFCHVSIGRVRTIHKRDDFFRQFNSLGSFLTSEECFWRFGNSLFFLQEIVVSSDQLQRLFVNLLVLDERMVFISILLLFLFQFSSIYTGKSQDITSTINKDHLK